MGLQEDHTARQPFFRVPSVVIGLLTLLFVAHVARVFAPPPWSDRVVSDFALTPIAYQSGGDLFHRIVPPFSHMLLHADWTHLAVNSLWLLAFGPVVARRFGAAAFLLFFVLCGLAGAAVFVAMDWGAAIGAIGASGAISGLMGAGIRMMDIRNPYLTGLTPSLQPLRSRQILLFSAVFLILNLASGWFGVLFVGPGQEIAWQAHLGGYVAGLLLSGVFERYFGVVRRVS